MLILNALILTLAIIGVYHIVEEVALEFFKKKNEQFLKDFMEEYEKRNDDEK